MRPKSTDRAQFRVNTNVGYNHALGIPTARATIQPDPVPKPQPVISDDAGLQTPFRFSRLPSGS